MSKKKKDKRKKKEDFSHKEKSEQENVSMEQETIQNTEEKLTETIEEKTEIEKIQEELEEYKDKYLRLLAEMNNMQRRMQKEKQETIRFAIENTIEDFLPPLDNLENALKFAGESSKEVKNWAIGFEMILSQFRDVLHNNGIIAFHSKGNIFDPHYHEAMEIIETQEHPDGIILEEIAKGYKSSSRTIRPAHVKVAKKVLPPEKKLEEEEEEEEKEKEKEKKL